MSFRGTVVCLSLGLTPTTVAQMCEMLSNYGWVWLPVKLNLRCQLHVAVLPLLRLAGCREWQAGCWLFQCKTRSAQLHTASIILCSLFDFCKTVGWFGLRHHSYYTTITHFCNNTLLTCIIIAGLYVVCLIQREDLWCWVRSSSVSSLWTCLCRKAHGAVKRFRGDLDASDSGDWCSELQNLFC